MKKNLLLFLLLIVFPAVMSAQCLSGTFKIGGAGSNYATIKDAVTALRQKGVCGAVNFKIANGTYEDFISLDSINGTSLTNQVIFESESGDSSKVIIKTSPYINCSFITLKGVSIYPPSTDPNGASSINMGAYIINTTIKNCYLKETDIRYNFKTEHPNLIISKNRFEYTSQNTNTAINLSGNFGIITFGRNIQIADNYIMGSSPIYISGGDSIYITGNTLLETHGPAIAMQFCGEVYVSKNDVSTTPGKSSYAIGIYSSYKQGYIRNFLNNYIHGAFEGGISTGSAENCRIYYNTIDLTGDQPDHAGIAIISSTYADVRNNIVNMNAGKALTFEYPTGLTMDHNNYHTNGAVLLSGPGEDFLDLNQWQVVKGFDLHSSTFAPQFSNGFHLADYNLNNRGTPLFVTDDKDGEPRSTTPDIGADEFSIAALSLDAGLVAGDTNLKYCDDAPKKVMVKLFNNGTTALTSATIKWKIKNVAQTDVNYSGGNILPGQYVYVTLGNITSKNGNQAIQAYISLANGATETNKRNDTCTIRNLKASMSGAYTIGSGNTNFQTLGEAVSTLKKNGICGPVVFTIKKGDYAGGFQIDSIKGSSPVNTVTFQSETTNFNDVRIENIFVQSTYITFKYLTFYGAASTRFAGNITYDHVRFGLYFSGIISSEQSNRIAYTYCHFDCSFQSTTPSSSPSSKGLLIENCTFGGNSGAYVETIDSVTIRKNKLKANISGATTPNWGLKINNCKGLEVSGNYIEGDYMRTLVLSSCGAPNLPALIFNNSIIAITSLSSNPVAIEYPNNLQFSYNTCYTGYSEFIEAGCLYVTDNLNGTFEIKNNIFVNKGKGNVASIYVNGNAGTIDHNVYYLKLGSPIHFKGVAQTFAAYQATSGFDQHSVYGNPDFVTGPKLYFTNDSVRAKGTPLNITNDIEDKQRDGVNPTAGAFESKPEIAHNKKDKDLAIVAVDTTFSRGSNIVSLRLKNKKLTPPNPYVVYEGSIDTIDVSYKWNDSSWVNEKWIGKLNVDDSIDFNFTVPVFIPRGKSYSFSVKAYINGNYQDLNLNNNTFDKKIQMPLNGEYTIAGLKPDFSTPVEALNVLKTNHASGPVTFNVRAGTFNVPMIEGNDTLTIKPDQSVPSQDVNLICSKIHASNLTLIYLTLHVKVDSTINTYEEMGLEINTQKVSILGCIIKGDANANGVYPNGLCVVNSSNVEIRSNQFNNFQSGLIYNSVKGLNGVTGTWSGSHVISYNNFQDCNVAFRVYAQSTGNNYELDIKDSIQVLSNFFQCEQNVILENNKIFLNFSKNSVRSNGPSFVVRNVSNGLSITNNSFSSTDKGLTDTIRVLFIQTKDHLFYYNSIWGTVQLENSPNLTMKNNAFYSERNPVLIWDQASPFTSDYNDYYTYGKVLAKKYTAPNVALDITDLDSLKLVTLQDQHSISFNPFYGSFYSLYSNSNFLKGKATPIPFITVDINETTRSTTAPSIGAYEVGGIQDWTWPGDADADSKVNNQDLLSIGLYNGETGQQRFPVSDEWKSFYCSNWSQYQYNQANMKHADCNGDGKVDSLDVNVISKNFGLVHMSNYRIANEETVAGPGNDLYFIMNNPKSSYTVNEPVEVEVWLGKAIMPATDVYGVSFDVVVPSTSFVTGSLNLSVSGSWLKTSGNNLFTLSKKKESEGRCFGSEVRNDHTNISGYGKIATLKFLSSGTKPGEDVYLKFQQVKLIDAQGNTLVVNPKNNSITNYKGDISTQIGDEQGGKEVFTLSPSVTSEQTIINYSLVNEETVSLQVFNMAGQLMYTLVQKKHVAGNYSVQLSIAENKLPAGVYFVRLTKGQEVKALKLVVTE
jgi:hypothetical protein